MSEVEETVVEEGIATPEAEAKRATRYRNSSRTRYT